MTARGEAEAALAALASLPDEAIDLAEAALALSALGPRATNSAPDPNPYRRHLSEIAMAVGAAAGASLGGRIEALNDVILGAFGYGWRRRKRLTK